MGYYHQAEPEPREPGGCAQVLVLTWAVFSILFWPMLALAAALGLVATAFILLTIHPALTLIPIGAGAAALWLYAKWERRHFRPPGT